MQFVQTNIHSLEASSLQNVQQTVITVDKQGKLPSYLAVYNVNKTSLTLFTQENWN